MPFPTDQINALALEYKLSDSESKTLAACLNIPGIKELVESGQLQLNNFFHMQLIGNTKKIYFLSDSEASNIVQIYSILKDTALFKEKKLGLGALFFWVTTHNTPYVHTFNSQLLQKINSAYLSGLTQLPVQYNEAISKQPKFKDIENEVNYLIKISHSDRIQRRNVALGIIEKYSVDLINDYLNFLATNPILLLLKSDCEKALERYVRLCGSGLRIEAANFFRELLTKDNKIVDDISYKLKYSGVQYGIVMKINYHLSNDSADKFINFFIKSHQSGHIYSSDKRYAISSNEPVDLKELFVYKVFEKLKLGPKTHFFFVNDADAGGLYIGTQDLSFSKKHAPNTKLFKTYDQYKTIKESHATNTTPETITGILQLDAFARIFHLADMNQGNFGQITLEEKQEITKEKWMLVDFTKNNEKYLNENQNISSFITDLNTYKETVIKNFDQFLHEATDKLFELNTTNTLSESALARNKQ